MAWRGAKKRNGIDLPDIELTYEEQALFPTIMLQKTRPPLDAEEDLYKVYKRFNECKPYYIKPKEPKKEVERYSDRFLQVDEHKKPELNFYFFPDELKSTKRAKKVDKAVDFDTFEKSEGKQKPEEDEEEQEEEEEEEEDDDDENDYAVDYYDDDHDAFGEESDREYS